MCEQKLFELKKKMRYKQFIVYANVFVFKNFNFRTIMCQTVLRKESSHTCNIQNFTQSNRQYQQVMVSV